MPVVAEQGFFFHFGNNDDGYSAGTTETVEHHTIPGFISVHVGLSRIQAHTNGPVGAAVGIMQFGDQYFGNDPANWQTAAYGNVGMWTTAGWVVRGDFSGWEFFQVWQ